jgi:uroporphyrinogen-III synthase
LSRIVLILRPEPGASATAERARALGLTPIVAPLFDLRPLAWDLPEPGRHDAILLTSASAARLGAQGLSALTGRPVYAVGEATAAAAYHAGFGDVRTGPADGAALLAMAAGEGVRRALHLCGRDHVPLRHPDVAVDTRIVYAAELRDGPVAIPPGAVVLLHSPRAAAELAARIHRRDTIRLAAISPAAARAAGGGWAAKTVAAEPRDEALLAVALSLCQKGGADAGAGG